MSTRNTPIYYYIWHITKFSGGMCPPSPGIHNFFDVVGIPEILSVLERVGGADSKNAIKFAAHGHVFFRFFRKNLEVPKVPPRGPQGYTV